MTLKDVYKTLLYSLAIRLIMIVVASLVDSLSNVHYTDIDYHVFSDAAVLVLKGQSPYDRVTYRYSPLIAYLLIPNSFLTSAWGKVVFSVADVICVALLWLLEEENAGTTTAMSSSSMSTSTSSSLLSTGKTTEIKRKLSETPPPELGEQPTSQVSSSTKRYYLLWAYNPLAIALCTRGSLDAVSNSMILLCLYFLKSKQMLRSGAVYGALIHLRLFPIIYLPAFAINMISENRPFFGDTCSKDKTYAQRISCLWKNLRGLVTFLFSTVAVLAVLTYVSYRMYGYDYLNNAILYHATRKDHRHNFSPHFYPTYLSMGVEDVSSAFSSETARVLLSGSTSQQSDLIGNVISKLLKFLPQLISILALALSLAGDFLAECLFLQTFTFVTFNSVVTAQYFSWYVIFLPLVMPNLQSLSTRMLYVMVGCWSASQAVWLFCAYLLEFQGVNTYLLIWVASVVFYMINVLIIVIIILKLPKVKSTSPRAKGNKLQQVKYKK